MSVWSIGTFVVPERAQTILRSLAAPNGAGLQILKCSARRAVLRVHPFSDALASAIVKGFPLQKLGSRFKYKKYGLNEFVHYAEAQQRNIPVPACYAYFEVRSLGMVTANGVLIEDLQGWSSLAELPAAIEPVASKQLERFARAIPLLAKLYETGVNHIDPSPQNFLASPDGKELRLLDWQYCSFVAPRQLAQLLLQAAHFLNYAKLSPGSPDGRQWLDHLWRACASPLPWPTWLSSIERLHARGRISATERLALALDPETAKLIAGDPN